VLTTGEFLDEILPFGGYKCLVFKPRAGGPMAHRWFDPDAIDEMERVALKADATGQFDVYHACAGYREKGERYKGRTQDNVIAVRSVWLDLDCGEGKDYPSQRDAGGALAGFCNRLNVARPTVLVNSGYGLHSYWTFPQELPLEIWKGWTANVARLAQENGFKVDLSRTRDEASILRPAGTHNYKHGASRLVQGDHVPHSAGS
jgi:hypothetical protein